jgi:hypothetical protein
MMSMTAFHPKRPFEAWLDRHQLRQESNAVSDPKTRSVDGSGPCGADIDSKGVVWVSRGSGHLASFHRRKCKGPLNGPNATGDQCPRAGPCTNYPGPGFAGIGDNSGEASYYTWVDQHNTLGLGNDRNDVPISTGNENDALLALVDGKWVVLRLLDSGIDPETIKPKRPYRRTRYFGRYELSRVCLAALRTASEPMSTDDIAGQVIAAKGFQADDAILHAAVRAQVKTSCATAAPRGHDREHRLPSREQVEAGQL